MRRLRKQPKKFVVRKVMSDAMAPDLIEGQLVICRHTEDIGVGDVVLVSKDGQETIKRIVRRQGNVLYQLADSTTNAETGEWIAAKYIVAKVVWPEL